jgi:hypothetical protein
MGAVLVTPRDEDATARAVEAVRAVLKREEYALHSAHLTPEELIRVHVLFALRPHRHAISS